MSADENGNPLFLATDIAKALGYANPRDAVARHCKSNGVVIRDVIDNMGRTQQARFITEGNLYRLITGSNLPESEMFESWIFDEVVPTVRKNGIYATDNFLEKSIADPDYAITILQKLKEEREMRLALAKENAAQQALLEEQKPKVVFADAIVGGKTNILIRDLAKLIQQNGYEIGEKRLFIWLRENKYLTISNMPMQRYVEMGLFFVDEGSHSESGVMKCHFTTKVTPKGQQYFVNKFLGGN